MKLLFDQNISHRILHLLPENYAESTSVKKEGLINANDKKIWELAKRGHYTIVTQDSDFNDLNALLGFPPKIIWIRTGNLNTKSLADLLIAYETDIREFISNDDFGCFEILNLR
jgi:predicted nuclease of predicted toxin-antitoxin system